MSVEDQRQLRNRAPPRRRAVQTLVAYDDGSVDNLLIPIVNTLGGMKMLIVERLKCYSYNTVSIR